MEQEDSPPRKQDAIQVDWIVLIASTIGLAVVVIASIRAGEGGLAAQLANFVTIDGK